MELLAWGFAFLNATELQHLLAVSPLRRELQQQLWYHACCTIQYTYPFLPPVKRRQDDWEVTFAYHVQRMARHIPLARAALRCGLTKSRLPRAAVAARQFLRRYCAPEAITACDAQLVAAVGCLVQMPRIHSRYTPVSMQNALEAGADPNCSLGYSTPYLARASDLDKPPLYFAVQAGNLEQVLQLLAAGASTTRTDCRGNTPLDYARKRLGCAPGCKAALALGTACLDYACAPGCKAALALGTA